LDRLQKAFEFAAEAAKLMIALATGIIAFTIVLLSQLVDDTPVQTATLQVAWIAYGIAIVCGLWALMALTATLARSDVRPNNLSVFSGTSPWAMAGEQLFFAIGIGLTVSFGVTSARAHKEAILAAERAADALISARSHPAPPPRPTVVTMEKVWSVGPFASADTVLPDSTWDVAARTLDSAIARFRQDSATLEAVLLAGGVDQRPLSRGPLRRFGSNEGLANARTEVVRARMAQVVDSTVQVFNIGLLAPRASADSTPAAMRQNRRVDVWFILRQVDTTRIR